MLCPNSFCHILTLASETVTSGRISMSFFISFLLLGIVKRMPCNGQDLCMSCSSWMLFFSLGGIRINCKCQLEAPSKKASCACQANSPISDSSTSTMKRFWPPSTGRVENFPLIFTTVPCKEAYLPERFAKLRTARSPGCSHWYCESLTSTWHSKCQVPQGRNHFKSFAAAAGVYASLDTAAAWTSMLATIRLYGSIENSWALLIIRGHFAWLREASFPQLGAVVFTHPRNCIIINQVHDSSVEVNKWFLVWFPMPDAHRTWHNLIRDHTCFCDKIDERPTAAQKKKKTEVQKSSKSRCLSPYFAARLIKLSMSC